MGSEHLSSLKPKISYLKPEINMKLKFPKPDHISNGLCKKYGLNPHSSDLTPQTIIFCEGVLPVNSVTDSCAAPAFYGGGGKRGPYPDSQGTWAI